ncbi:hypothetical protein [Salinisphaera hydrothermalis]|uniref:Uncharacterized protein n=1 Tax=Salinisphaera hydrothermalis (strain C41B8) TaxID=1304275 RepID=A0A084IPX2_SALHC|nr:hypothetical protein [Salinisphaera hydrothermalis]KEZ78756.1 hypothetical protein C41B8_04036 [Salinisphaera hydrothermalis C41B8]
MLLFDMELSLIELPLIELLLIELSDMLLSDMAPPDIELELMLLLDIEFEDMALSDDAALSLLSLPQAARPTVSRAAAVTIITFFIFDAFLKIWE